MTIILATIGAAVVIYLLLWGAASYAQWAARKDYAELMAKNAPKKD